MTFHYIPISSKTSFNLKLIEKIENVIKWMRWTAYFFLKGTVMQIENALINDRLRVSKVSRKFRIPSIYNFVTEKFAIYLQK